MLVQDDIVENCDFLEQSKEYTGQANDLFFSIMVLIYPSGLEQTKVKSPYSTKSSWTSRKFHRKNSKMTQVDSKFLDTTLWITSFSIPYYINLCSPTFYLRLCKKNSALLISKSKIRNFVFDNRGLRSKIVCDKFYGSGTQFL